MMQTTQLLGALVTAMASGRIRVVDLTQTLTPDFPQIALPPEMGQCWPFRIEEVSAYDERGPGWYWNNFSCGEHTGTHFDAPIHWISGRDLPNNAVDTIPVQHFVAPACVIDCSEQVKADPDYLLTVDDIARFESTHGSTRRGRAPRRCSSSSSSATCSASAPRPSAPTPARATTCAPRTPATTSCTGPGATACSACPTSTC